MRETQCLPQEGTVRRGVQDATSPAFGETPRELRVSMERIRSDCGICTRPSVWGFLNVSGSTIPCECGTRSGQATCVCGDCYSIGRRVFTYPKNSTKCPDYGATDCQACREEAAAAAASPAPSLTPVSTPPSTASSVEKSTGGGGSTIAIAITAIVMVIVGVALALWYHGHKTKRNARKRRRLARQEQEVTSIPEPEYVVVVYPVAS